MKILIITAHILDAEVSMGGTIAKLVEQGHEVYITYMNATLEKNHYSSAIRIESNNISKRVHNNIKTIIKKSCKVLGIEDFRSHFFPDSRFDTISELDFIKIIEDDIKFFNPTLVYTHSRNDLLKDSNIIRNVVLNVCNSSIFNNIEKIFSFKCFSGTIFNGLNDRNTNWFESLKIDHITKKFEALSCYHNLFMTETKYYTKESIFKFAEVCGLKIDKDYGEEFELIRCIK